MNTKIISIVHGETNIPVYLQEIWNDPQPPREDQLNEALWLLSIQLRTRLGRHTDFGMRNGELVIEVLEPANAPA